MTGFILGFTLATVIGTWWHRRKDREFRNTLTAIYEGKAEPDENGFVGWCIP